MVLICVGNVSINLTLLTILLLISKSLLSLVVYISVLLFEILVIYPIILFRFSNKISKTKKHKIFLSTLYSFILTLPFCVLLISISLTYYVPIFFVWFSIWSILGAIKSEDKEQPENHMISLNKGIMKLLKYFVALFIGFTIFNVFALIFLGMGSIGKLFGLYKLFGWIEVLLLYPFVILVFTRKLIQKINLKVALVFLSPLVVSVSHCLCYYFGCSIISPVYIATIPYVFSYLFLWCLIWSLLGAFTQKNKKHPENDLSQSED